MAVKESGLNEVRRIPAFHDHPLKGELAGKRAISLSKKWRAVYEIKGDGLTEFVFVDEVHAHDY